MSDYTRDEALAFIDAMRLTLDGKVGFKWHVQKLADLGTYVRSVADENERLNGYLDNTDRRTEYEAYLASLQDDPSTDGEPETT
jgi:hypothetical protein